MAFEQIGIELTLQAEGENEIGINNETGKPIIEVDPQYFRPTEVELLLGDPSKACENLGWEPKYSIDALVKDMIKGNKEKVRSTVLSS